MIPIIGPRLPSTVASSRVAIMKASTSPLLDILHRPRHVASSSSPTLVHVKQTLLQSCNPFLSELIHTTISREERIILISSGERDPDLLYPGLASDRRPNASVIAVDHSAGFEEVGSSAGDGWASKLLKQLQISEYCLDRLFQDGDRAVCGMLSHLCPSSSQHLDRSPRQSSSKPSTLF